MFGRRKQPVGSPAMPPTPLPPDGQDPFPIDKMDRALDGAIRLFTRVLDEAGVDAGGLALRGPVPDNVGELLAECTTYRHGGEGELTYLALGITTDFKGFSYPPHCRLYFILNSVGICEDPHAAALLPQLAPTQLPDPLIDAHFMRRWIRFILPVGAAMSQGRAAMEPVMVKLIDELIEVVRLVPKPFADRIDLESRLREWASGYPGTIGRPLDDGVRRMNGLPVTPFIEEQLINELARLQAEGLRQRHG